MRGKMKLKQKLVMVLATVLLVASTPVQTIAASVNQVSKVVVAIASEKPLGDKAPELIIKLKDGWSNEDFYLELVNANWVQDAKINPIVYGNINGEQVEIGKFERLSNQQARIRKATQYNHYIEEIKEIRILLSNVTLTGGDAAIVIDGANSEITSGKYIIAEMPKSNSANLTNIQLSEGVLTPEFKADIMHYTITVGNEVDRIWIKAEAEHPKAIILGLGEKALLQGQNVFEIGVIAEDGTVKIYTLKITREFLDEDLNQDNRVDEQDIAILAQKHNITKQEEKWDERKDFNRDGIIDLFDLVYLSILVDKK